MIALVAITVESPAMGRWCCGLAGAPPLLGFPDSWGSLRCRYLSGGEVHIRYVSDLDLSVRSRGCEDGGGSFWLKGL